MNKILSRVLSAILVLCMIPAAFITAFAHGEGVAKNETENQSLDLAQTQYIPETVIVDGKFDDAGWAVEEWNDVDSSTGIWDTENPLQKNRDVSYKYQLHYDSKYFYVAAVITMPEDVTKGEFSVYLSERRHLNYTGSGNDPNRGASSGFTFTIDLNAADEEKVKVRAEQGADEKTAAYANKRTQLKDSLLKANVQNRVVTIEFRNDLDSTVDKDYTVYGAYANKGSNGGNNISYYVSMNLPHVDADNKNDVGSTHDKLFHPIWAQGVSAAMVPTAENWPERYANPTLAQRTSLLVNKGKIDLANLISIDGNLDEAQWKDQMYEVNSATGTYIERPFDGNTLSYSFNVIADSQKLYGAVIIDAEAGKDLDAKIENDKEETDLGTQFEIWFKGKDNRANMEINGVDIDDENVNNDSDVASMEYEFYKLFHKKTDKDGNVIEKDSYYTTELTYYINHQYTFQLYKDGTYNNERGDRELYYDVNPEAAPDYYVTKDNNTWVRNEKTFGEDGAYNYAYKVIDGKTYLEFWIDLKSVHCDVNDIEIFVSTRHMQHTNAGTRNNLKLYYPKLLIDNSGTYAETSNMWVTHYNLNYNDASLKYGPDGAYVRDSVGIIFDNYQTYQNTMNYLGSWWNEVLLQKVPDTTNAYTIKKIKYAGDEAEVGAGGKLENPGNCIWYCFGTGTYYKSGTHLNVVTSPENPVDTTNNKAYLAQQNFAKWNVGDVLGLNFNYRTEINASHKTITYHGRLDANATDDIVVTNIGMTTTHHTPTQEISPNKSAKYVKFEIQNDSDWTFVSQVNIYCPGTDGNVQYIQDQAEYTTDGVSNPKDPGVNEYPDNNQKNKLNDGEGVKSTETTSYSDPRYVGFNKNYVTNGTKPSIIFEFPEVYENITGFGIWTTSNQTTNSGISCPEKVTVYVSLDGQNWEYATDIVPTQKTGAVSSSAFPNVSTTSNVKAISNRANAYYSPYTVTRIYKENSLTNNTGDDQNTSCFYWWRNRHMPAFDKYGETKAWMYDVTKDVIAAAHIAPDVIAIDDKLGDSGWNQYGWTEVDGAINGTGKGPGYIYQMRSDGEYLYVASVIDSTNPTFGLWIKSTDGKINYYEIANGSTTTLDVETPKFTANQAVDVYENEAAAGATISGTQLTYQNSLKAMQWDNGWTTLAYEDSTFYGYTKELMENRRNGIGTAWTAISETKGFRFGVESARIGSADAFVRYDLNGNVQQSASAYDLKPGTTEQRTVEFKIALSEFNGLNGFEYVIQVKDGENSSFYPQLYNETTGFITDGQPTWSEFAFKVSAEDVINGGKLWLRNEYAPMTSLGARVTDDYNGSGQNAIRFGARFTENFIRKQKVTDTEVTDYWDVADAGIIFAPTVFLENNNAELTLENEAIGVIRTSARDIINWVPDTNMADYESFVFYVTYKGFPDSAKTYDFQFCGYIDYYEANGSDTYYSQIFARSYNGVVDNIYYTNEQDEMPTTGSYE